MRNNAKAVEGWLIERLEKPAWVADLKAETEAFSWDVPIGWRTVEKLKRKLGIKSYHASMGWVWYLPPVHLDAVKAFAEDSYPASMPVTADGMTTEEIQASAVYNLAVRGRNGLSTGEFRTATQVELIVMKECRSNGVREKMTADQVREIIRCQVFDEMGRPSEPE